MSTCDVILAVWNGQNYLSAMLNSLLSQTTSDFNVLVRDDGSTDGLARNSQATNHNSRVALPSSRASRHALRRQIYNTHARDQS